MNSIRTRQIITLKDAAEIGLPGSNWFCGIGNCSRKAEFILLKPTVIKGQVDVEAIGLCERCGLTYSRRNGTPLPKEAAVQ